MNPLPEGKESLWPLIVSPAIWAAHFTGRSPRGFCTFPCNALSAPTVSGIDAPPLDDPDLALKGAGHYETGCRSCHGSPEMKQPRIAQRMTPSPPYLPSKISEWDREELFLSRKTWRKIHRHARVAFSAARRRGMGDGRVSAEAAESRREWVPPSGARRACRNPAHPELARTVSSPLRGRSELHAMPR
jgi:hypothetical protein